MLDRKTFSGYSDYLNVELIIVKIVIMILIVINRYIGNYAQNVSLALQNPTCSSKGVLGPTAQASNIFYSEKNPGSQKESTTISSFNSNVVVS